MTLPGFSIDFRADWFHGYECIYFTACKFLKLLILDGKRFGFASVFSCVISAQCYMGHEADNLAEEDNFGIILCEIGSFSWYWSM